MEDNELTEPFLVRLKAVIDADPNLNVSKLATDSGLANSTIRKMFRDNKSPRSSTMRKICAALGTTLEEFMSNAQTAEEQEIVRLFAQLPEPLKQQLLGYGRGLAAAADPSPPKSAEENE
ncbi:helix-turn-helix transcriptional regulator [Phaeobacter gallaeciensis]|uniref:helix-turn-helix domain-containing protein n=1 Tax=Phaeobacter gallaeciensis TaxID=60890 RepID=UPI002380686C|nr:helix-turn-helix transcriptional regulator [Phaeobacter gallaeciensis]MDE4272977.1 helix-turn-helix transcriptional regulator [Phaeobacter gallaeciensis]MDE4298070.1 helix-turn-helix transcriptional regulator [Phaeobacter gallaeciensis]MDE5183258.1 helix-turn-helix transcriptional regulator [Phaeobacter gallaeciensis]